jgi:hypothetical protein
MKTLIVLTALAAGLALTQQANACDWMHQAAQPSTTATCEDGNCPADQQASQEAATTETTPAAPQSAQEPAPASPTVVAQGQ